VTSLLIHLFFGPLWWIAFVLAVLWIPVLMAWLFDM